MTSTPVDPGAGGRPGRSSRRASSHSALLGGALALALAIVAVIVFAHALRGTANAATGASAAATTSTNSMHMGPGSSMNMGPGSSMSGSSTGTKGSIPIVRGASLPMMQSSGAMPKAMAMVPLGDATWEGMSIQARTSAPASFELFNGTSQQLVQPTRKTSFHLMILLSDKATGVAIPYSSVWATVKKGDRIVFDERLWPMISRYMGPHYGNNVSLPGAGLYTVTLLVSPPVAARHHEYKNAWLKPHRVTMSFRWVPKG